MAANLRTQRPGGMPEGHGAWTSRCAELEEAESFEPTSCKKATTAHGLGLGTQGPTGFIELCGDESGIYGRGI